MDKMRDLKLNASKDTLYTVLDVIEAHLDKNGCPDSVKLELLIAVEEIYMNIANYAYGGEAGEVTVQMEISQDPKVCQVIFKDKGIPYDPLKREDPDISLSPQERGIGGLGIYMVKQLMDRVEYRYEDETNILLLERRMDQQR